MSQLLGFSIHTIYTSIAVNSATSRRCSCHTKKGLLWLIRKTLTRLRRCLKWLIILEIENSPSMLSWDLLYMKGSKCDFFNNSVLLNKPVLHTQTKLLWMNITFSFSPSSYLLRLHMSGAFSKNKPCSTSFYWSVIKKLLRMHEGLRFAKSVFKAF